MTHGLLLFGAEAVPLRQCSTLSHGHGTQALPPIVKEYVPLDKGPKPVPEFVVKVGTL